MKHVYACLVLATLVATAHDAFAEGEEDPPEPSAPAESKPTSPVTADRPAEQPPSAREKEPAIGYKLEAGAATTHISQGAWKYATKTTPATEDFAGLRVRFGDYGMITAGGSASIALASASGQPQTAEELTPTLTHSVQLAPVSLTTGFRVKMFPRATGKNDVDGAYEGILKAALPNPYVTPVFELAPEFVRKKGTYGLVGAEHKFELWRLAITPRAQFGMQGYEVKSERFHPNEVMVTAPAKLKFDGGLYALFNPGYSVLVEPAHYLKDSSFSGRSVGFALLAFGAER
jgi:hypothetical protein